MNEGKITFQGPAPFHLPVAQRATAAGHTKNGVSVTLDCIVESQGASPVPISVQMISKVARELAVSLMAAADKADGRD